MSRSELDRATFPPGQFQEREMSDLYGFDDMGSVWRRVAVDTMGRLITVGGGGGGVGITDTDDNAIAPGQTTLLAIDENYVYDPVAGDWIRLEGGVDNSPGPATPQVAFVGGVVTDPVDAFVDGDVSGLHFDLGGRLLVSGGSSLLEAFAPFELANSQAPLAASGTFVATTQQNLATAGSGGRAMLHGFVHYAGVASDLTVTVSISLDAGATFIVIDTFTVVSGTPTVIRELSVALGNRVRVTVTNNDAASGTGTTNIGFYLTPIS